VERWNGGTVERWNGRTVERSARLALTIGYLLRLIGGFFTLSHDVALTVPTAEDKGNHFERQNARERVKTRENSQNQSLPFAFVIRGHSREFAAIRVSNCSLCPRQIWFAIAGTRMTRMFANVRESSIRMT
jgi:hypothetical protein